MKPCPMTSLLAQTEAGVVCDHWFPGLSYYQARRPEFAAYTVKYEAFAADYSEEVTPLAFSLSPNPQIALSKVFFKVPGSSEAAMGAQSGQHQHCQCLPDRWT